jgi:hypothetical protein
MHRIVYVKGFRKFQFLPFKYFGSGIKWLGADVSRAPLSHQDDYADDVGARNGRAPLQPGIVAFLPPPHTFSFLFQATDDAGKQSVAASIVLFPAFHQLNGLHLSLSPPSLTPSLSEGGGGVSLFFYYSSSFLLQKGGQFKCMGFQDIQQLSSCSQRC